MKVTGIPSGRSASTGQGGAGRTGRKDAERQRRVNIVELVLCSLLQSEESLISSVYTNGYTFFVYCAGL